MTQAQTGDTVRVHYTGKLADETVFDSSEGRDPLEFTIGSGEIIPGFERAVVGMEPGETRTAMVEAIDAYGPYQDEMVLEVDRGQFPDGVEPEVGQQYQIAQANGAAMVVTVTDVVGQRVTLDANHPLAGRDLTFEIELVEIV